MLEEANSQIIMDNQTFLIQGKSDDYLILNTGKETSWYRLEYDNLPETHPIAIEANEAKNRHLKQINIPFFLFVGFVLFIIIPDMLTEITLVTIFSTLFNSILMTAIFYFVVLMMPISPVTSLWKAFPLLGDPEKVRRSYIKEHIQNEEDHIPNYEHIITITSYDNRSGYTLSEFVGYRVRRSTRTKGGRGATGYWLHAVVKGDEVIILPEKELRSSERELIYTAAEFSLQSIGRSVVNDGKVGLRFIRGLATGDNNQIVASVEELKLLEGKTDFLNNLKRSNINLDAPVPEEYLNS